MRSRRKVGEGRCVFLEPSLAEDEGMMRMDLEGLSQGHPLELGHHGVDFVVEKASLLRLFQKLPLALLLIPLLLAPGGFQRTKQGWGGSRVSTPA